MPDAAEEPVAAGPAPVRTWRPMVFWTAGILLLAGLAWFVGAGAVPAWQTRRVLSAFTASSAWRFRSSSLAVT